MSVTDRIVRCLPSSVTLGCGTAAGALVDIDEASGGTGRYAVLEATVHEEKPCVEHVCSEVLVELVAQVDACWHLDS